jgi:hypothetical protein
MYKRFGIPFLAIVFGTLCLGLSDRLPGTSDYTLVSSAHAIVGRPLTPVSVAGVARRTARRCAVGVYNC